MNAPATIREVGHTVLLKHELNEVGSLSPPVSDLAHHTYQSLKSEDVTSSCEGVSSTEQLSKNSSRPPLCILTQLKTEVVEKDPNIVDQLQSSIEIKSEVPTLSVESESSNVKHYLEVDIRNPSNYFPMTVTEQGHNSIYQTCSQPNKIRGESNTNTNARFKESRHKSLSESSEFQSTICSGSFSEEPHLNQHIFTHTVEEVCNCSKSPSSIPDILKEEQKKEIKELRNREKQRKFRERRRRKLTNGQYVNMSNERGNLKQRMPTLTGEEALSCTISEVGHAVFLKDEYTSTDCPPTLHGNSTDPMSHFVKIEGGTSFCEKFITTGQLQLNSSSPPRDLLNRFKSEVDDDVDVNVVDPLCTSSEIKQEHELWLEYENVHRNSNRKQNAKVYVRNSANEYVPLFTLEEENNEDENICGNSDEEHNSKVYIRNSANEYVPASTLKGGNKYYKFALDTGNNANLSDEGNKSYESVRDTGYNENLGDDIPDPSKKWKVDAVSNVLSKEQKKEKRKEQHRENQRRYRQKLKMMGVKISNISSDKQKREKRKLKNREYQRRYWENKKKKLQTEKKVVDSQALAEVIPIISSQEQKGEENKQTFRGKGKKKFRHNS